MNIENFVVFNLILTTSFREEIILTSEKRRLRFSKLFK
jgi:hypothetical protein